MIYRHLIPTCVILLAAAVLPFRAAADESSERETAAIRAAAANYVKALEAGKAEAIAAAWTADGDYVDAAGRSFKARDLIAQVFSKTDNRRPAEWKMTVDSIRLTTADVAVEDGQIVHPAPAGEPPPRTRYTALWVKRDGRWLLDSLRESALLSAPQNPRFADLKWLLGEFTGRSGDGTHVVVSGAMSGDGNYLLREILVTSPEHRIKAIHQRIGWDPLAGGFRSWTFESDGGFGEGVWRREGDSWIVNSLSTTADGKRASTTGIYSQITDDGMLMQSSGATIEGQPQPDRKVMLTREAGDK